MTKIYHALVQGHPDPFTGTVDAPIDRHPQHDYKFAVVAGGKHSVTHYETLEAFREFYHEFSDFQHAYEAGVYVGAGQDGRPLAGTGQDLPPVVFNAGNAQFNGNVADAFRFAINPPNRGQINPVFPDLVV